MKKFTDTEFMRRSFGSTSPWLRANYTVRLHWADTPETPWVEREGTNWETVSRPTTVLINGKTVIENLNVRDKVGTFHAYAREFKDIQPQNGIIELRFNSTPNHEAMIQAVEIIPDKNGDERKSARPSGNQRL